MDIQSAKRADRSSFGPPLEFIRSLERKALARVPSPDWMIDLIGYEQPAGTTTYEYQRDGKVVWSREARICYDHQSGVLGVSIADALRGSGAVEIADDAAALTETGWAQMQDLGILAPGTLGARPICRPCLDWSLRRPIWQAFWGPPPAPMRWIRAGSGGAREHGRWRSHLRAGSVLGRPSGLKILLGNQACGLEFSHLAQP